MKKVILITGASSGIGRAVAENLSEKHIVYGTSRKEQKHDEIRFLTLDVSEQESIDNCVRSIIEKEGRIDVLINNAGFAMVGPLLGMSIDNLQWQLDVNLLGVHRMISATIPHMKNGYIINLGSFGGRMALPYQTPYSLSKAALAIYSDGLRMELHSRQISVSLIEPGDTKTEFDSGRVYCEGYNGNVDADRAIGIMRESEKNGVSPQKIVRVVNKILKSKNPKPRYTTGPDAKIFGFLQRFLPYTIQEKLIMMTYKIPKK